MGEFKSVRGQTVEEAVTGRRSIRQFLNKEVSQETVRDILRAASRAPSGTNIQPWLVHVVVGAARDRLCRAAREAALCGEISLEYAYLPNAMKEPYRGRRRKVGFDLYDLYGIDHDDVAARREAMLRNYDLFGAPIGLFVTMERDHALGAWLDCGMFMQNIMVVARLYGLDSCAQQAWCDIGAVVHKQLNIPDEHIILSGLALGFADPAAAANRLVSGRVPVDDFTTWHC